MLPFGLNGCRRRRSEQSRLIGALGGWPTQALLWLEWGCSRRRPETVEPDWCVGQGWWLVGMAEAVSFHGAFGPHLIVPKKDSSALGTAEAVPLQIDDGELCETSSLGHQIGAQV